LVNKGFRQGQLGQSEEAIKTYDEVLHRFGDASELALKEQVAIALNGMGFFSLILAKTQWADRDAANALLHKARDSLSQAIIKMPQSWGMALGNRAYAQWLLGNFTEAETDFEAGLRAEKFAGQELYEVTLKDFDIHLIPEDQSMREMVERLWTDHQNEQPAGVGHA
jgi:tetratricopeptide (TPR) repeat protein